MPIKQTTTFIVLTALLTVPLVAQTLEEIDRNVQERAARSKAAGEVKTDPSMTRYGDLVPINDLGENVYQGKQGGLYPKGSNSRPKAHNEAGLALANSVKPLDKSGKVDEQNGKIVLMSVGFSNTTQGYQLFQRQANQLPNKNPQLYIFDGAISSQDVLSHNNTESEYWKRVMQRLSVAGLTPEQVQVVWFKTTSARLTPANKVFPSAIPELEEMWIKGIHAIKTLFPNVKIIYCSSRTYGGYAIQGNNEPFCWISGWVVKQMIEDQINGRADLRYAGDNAAAAWLSWGPYLWANGEVPRKSDGLIWKHEDMEFDGVHPSSTTGRPKVAKMLLDFFTTDETTVPWFLKK